MKRMSKKLVAARVQNAVCGFAIPMMAIVKLYGELEKAVLAGKSDAELKLIVAAFPEVEKA